MGRAQFGGGPDYSSVFASLLGSASSGTTVVVRPQAAEAPKNYAYSSQAKAEREAEQTAEDQNTLDQWSNGLIDDEELLTYIERRVRETAGDAKDHQKWIKAQRYYTNGIADAQAVEAYEKSGDANALVAYWEKRKADVQADSQEGRDVAAKLREAKNTRASKDINAGWNRITEQIELGDATPRDLLRFMQEQRKLLPAGDLRDSVSEKIDELESQARTAKASAEKARIDYEFDAGKINGTQAATRYRTLAEQYKTSDPATYFSLLDTALGYAGEGGGTGGGGGRSGGGGSSGGGSGSGGGDTTNIVTTTLDSLTQRDKRFQSIFDQIQTQLSKNGGQIGFYVTDPANPSEPIAVSEGNLKKMADDWTAIQDKLVVAYKNRRKKNGDPYADNAENITKAQNRKIEITTLVSVPLGTTPFNRAITVVANAAINNIALAAESDNPNDVLSATVRAADQIDRIIQTSTKGVNILGIPGMPVIPPDYMPSADAITEARNLSNWLRNGNGVPTGNAIVDAAVADQVEATLPKNMVGGNTLKSVGEAISNAQVMAQGLADGSLVRVVASDGTHVVPQDAYGRPDTSGADLGGARPVLGTRTVDGVETLVWYIADPATYTTFNGTPLQQYVGAGVIIDGKEVKGVLTDAQLKKLSDEGRLKQALANGLIASEDFQIPGVYQIVMPSYVDKGKVVNGGVKYWDAATGAVSDFLPVDIVLINEQGTASINAKGEATVEYGQFATGASDPFPAQTSDPERLQQQINNGTFGGLLPTDSRGVDGELTGAPADWSTSFYDPKHEERYIHRSRLMASGPVDDEEIITINRTTGYRRKAEAIQRGMAAEHARAEKQYGEQFYSTSGIDQVAETAQRLGFSGVGGLKITPTEMAPVSAEIPQLQKKAAGPAINPVSPHGLITLPKAPAVNPVSPHGMVPELDMPDLPSTSFVDTISSTINSALKLPTVGLPKVVKTTAKKPGVTPKKKKAPTTKKPVAGKTGQAVNERTGIVAS